MIEAAGRFGARVYYGDGTRLDVLRAAGAGRVKLIAVCTDAVATTDKVVAVVREAFPDTPCFARAFDRRHSLELIRRGVAVEVRETLESALLFGAEVLVGLGAPREEADAIRGRCAAARPGAARGAGGGRPLCRHGAPSASGRSR